MRRRDWGKYRVGVLRLLLLLLLLISVGFSGDKLDKLDPTLKALLKKEGGTLSALGKVKVLRKDGRVEVIDLRRRSLQSLIDDPDVIYIEAPRKLEPLDDVKSNSYKLQQCERR